MNARPTGLREHVSLAPLTTFEVGGPARFLLEPASVDETLEGLAWAAREGVAVVVLGGGSNVLIADRGLDALVLRPRLRGTQVEVDGAFDVVSAAAGESWTRFVSDSVDANRGGVECLAGIPGDVGAVPIQNVGAYGQEVAETICDVDAIERANLKRVTLTRSACQFGYRDSIFKHALRDQMLIVAVRFRLLRGASPTLRYAELRQHFEATPEPSLASVHDAVLSLRRKKSMLLEGADENHRSAGSFFTNPVVSLEAAQRVEERARALGTLRDDEKMPCFPGGSANVKLSAGWLIERSGLPKGTHRGRVGLSTRHALAIVNRGGAQADEILAFAQWIRSRVHSALGVPLTPEPTLLGFREDELCDLRRADGNRHPPS